VKIGVIVPAAASDSDGGRPSWPAIVSFARAAEAYGLDSVWMFDHFFHKPSSGPIDGQLEAWTVVSALAAATDRVEIGTLVLCSSYSGDTEETLACYEAAGVIGARRVAVGAEPGDAIAANGPSYPWQGAGKALRHADITFGNLECAVSTRGEPFPKQYNFRATPAALAGLRRNSGLDVLNLANNHVGDYGPDATIDTVRGVERLGMKAVGAGPDLQRL
jgi:hypothetical protein